MISKLTVDRVFNRVNIVDVVSDYVDLKKSGVNYKGLCPFHHDHTPSFVVSPSKGIAHCFVCGGGGNAVWKSHTNLTHPGKYFRPSKVKIMRPTSPK